MTPENIAKACSGTMVNCENILGKEVTAVTTDSRKVTEGCLYIPMKGAKFNGHDFIPQVMESGALLTLTEKDSAAEGYPYIKVKRTDIAIQRIAEFYRLELGIPVVGITGYHGGKLKELADYHMDVMEDDMQISEDLHMIFDHMMYFVLNQG